MRTLIRTAIAGVFGPLIGAAQPPQPSLTLRVNTQLVEVSVVVKDAHGIPVTDLKPSDFELYDRGRRQEIRVFKIENHKLAGQPLFTTEFLNMVADVDVEPVKLPPRSPNLNAHAERFVRSIKESCLEQMILFGEESLRTAISNFVAHYHTERNHQGLANRLITPEAGHLGKLGWSSGVSAHSGMLNYYYRAAA